MNVNLVVDQTAKPNARLLLERALAILSATRGDRDEGEDEAEDTDRMLRRLCRDIKAWLSEGPTEEGRT